MRQSDRRRLEKIWQAVERQPGVKASDVAQELKLARSSVTRALPEMEARGLLLSEDDRGGLWPWGRQSQK
jgi:Mn-dependent DtxR family transcriptional regulator